MRKWFLFTVAAALLTICVASETCGRMLALKRNRRTINGKHIRPHEFPWMVSMQINGWHHCGGTLISRDYVVTAAHCLYGADEQEVEAVLGLHRLSDKGIRLSGKIIFHPEFAEHEKHLGYDIALFHLNQSFEPSIQPICLPKTIYNTLEAGENVVATGWGVETTRRHILLSKNVSDSQELDDELRYIYSTDVDQELKQVTFKIEKAEECDKLYDSYDKTLLEFCKANVARHQLSIWCRMRSAFKDTQVWLNESVPYFCGVSHGHWRHRQSLCNGDSGGPLMKRSIDGLWTFVGITISGPFDCNMFANSHHQIGGDFPDVSYHVEWIKAEANLHSAPNSSASSCSLLVCHTLLAHFVVLFWRFFDI